MAEGENSAFNRKSLNINRFLRTDGASPTSYPTFDWGYCGWLLDTDRFGSRGAGRMFGVLAARTSGGDRWVEALLWSFPGTKQTAAYDNVDFVVKYSLEL